MKASLQGALNQIETSYRSFIFKHQPMTKDQVRSVLLYGLSLGRKDTSQISGDEIDAVIKGNIKPRSFACTHCPVDESGKKIFDITIGESYVGTWTHDPAGWKIQNDSGWESSVFFDITKCFELE